MTGEHCHTFSGHGSWVNSVVVTSDGRYAVSGSGDCDLKLWDLQTGHLHFTLAGHESWVSAVSVTRDGRHAISCSNDRTVRLWDLEQRCCKAMVMLESAPWTVATAPDGRTAVVGDRGGNVHCYIMYAN
jgi:WD40 repeat protein